MRELARKVARRLWLRLNRAQQDTIIEMAELEESHDRNQTDRASITVAGYRSGR